MENFKDISANKLFLVQQVPYKIIEKFLAFQNQLNEVNKISRTPKYTSRRLQFLRFLSNLE